MEANEMQEFADHMKEAGESLTSISLAISILAVLVAMVTVLGHRTHTEAVLMESRATDQWNEYQAKKIRTDNLGVTIDLLGMQPPTASVTAKLGEYNGRIAKWKGDLKEQEAKAREFEAEVNLAERRADRYDLGGGAASDRSGALLDHALHAKPGILLPWIDDRRGGNRDGGDRAAASLS